MRRVAGVDPRGTSGKPPDSICWGLVGSSLATRPQPPEYVCPEGHGDSSAVSVKLCSVGENVMLILLQRKSRGRLRPDDDSTRSVTGE